MGPPFKLGRPTARARELRHQATDAERRLWKHLRGAQIEGVKFSRQMPIAGFVCDFVSRSHRLVIEVDGGQHGWLEAEDRARTVKLEAAGYRVVRFWNNDVMERLEGVLIQIASVLRGAHPPTPSRLREGGLDAPSRQREGRW